MTSPRPASQPPISAMSMPEHAYAQVDRSETQTIRRKPSHTLSNPVIEIHADRPSRVGSRACDGVTAQKEARAGLNRPGFSGDSICWLPGLGEIGGLTVVG